MNSGIAINLIRLAVSEGQKTAVETAECLRDALETIAMVGDIKERSAAGFLLESVHRAVGAVTDRNRFETYRAAVEARN